MAQYRFVRKLFLHQTNMGTGQPVPGPSYGVPTTTGQQQTTILFGLPNELKRDYIVPLTTGEQYTRLRV